MFEKKNVEHKILSGIFYDLIDSHIPAGKLRGVVSRNVEGKNPVYLDGWLGSFAESMAESVLGERGPADLLVAIKPGETVVNRDALLELIDHAQMSPEGRVVLAKNDNLKGRN